MFSHTPSSGQTDSDNSKSKPKNPWCFSDPNNCCVCCSWFSFPNLPVCCTRICFSKGKVLRNTLSSG